MKRLLNVREVRNIVFGSPSAQLGDKTNSIREITKAINQYKNKLQELSNEDYKKIVTLAENAKPDFVHYGCYGAEENEIFFVVEFYRFNTNSDAENCLFVVIAKPFTCDFCGGKTANDVIVDYNGEIESNCFFGSYANFVSKNEIVINNRTIKLIKHIPVDTEPEEFYAMINNV